MVTHTKWLECSHTFLGLHSENRWHHTFSPISLQARRGRRQERTNEHEAIKTGGIYKQVEKGGGVGIKSKLRDPDPWELSIKIWLRSVLRFKKTNMQTVR